MLHENIIKPIYIFGTKQSTEEYGRLNFIFFLFLLLTVYPCMHSSDDAWIVGIYRIYVFCIYVCFFQA
jgi:hypothetical protein